MISLEDARRLALALPEAVEQDHHGRPSFRVAGKIFATQWDAEHMNVMLDEGGILTALDAHPEVCELFNCTRFRSLVSPKSRLPFPSTTGNTITRSSSTRSCSRSA